MTESMRTVLRAALTHLRFYRDQVTASIEQLEQLLDKPIVDDLHQHTSPKVCETLAKAPLRRPTLPAAERASSPPANAPSPEQASPAPAKAATKSQTRQAWIVELLRTHPDGMVPAAIATTLKLTGDAVKAAAAQLIAAGTLVAEGSTHSRRYRLAQAPEPKVVAAPKPNGKGHHDDELEVVWNGSSKRPLSSTVAQ